MPKHFVLVKFYDYMHCVYIYTNIYMNAENGLTNRVYGRRL